MSAIIYQFPAGGRASQGGRRDSASSGARLDPRLAMTACGSAWYHEEAMRDERDEPRKN